MTALTDENVPLCFDTSAVYGTGQSVELLDDCRGTWPHRRIIIPAIVVAEQVRHWMDKQNRPFNRSMFESFLSNYEVAGFDGTVALESWHEVLRQLQPQNRDEPWVWRFDKPPAPLTRTRARACAQVCRWPDHAINAICRCHRALLVTDRKSVV